MRLIILTQVKFAQVDDEDFEFLNQWKWYAYKHGRTFYAYRANYQKNTKRAWPISMHRQLLNLLNDKRAVDHIDHNGLNNQKENLRISIQGGNNCNKLSAKNSSSKYLGVSWHKINKNWVACITKNNKFKHLGSFNKEQDAAIAYNRAAKELHGEFANINII